MEDSIKNHTDAVVEKKPKKGDVREIAITAKIAGEVNKTEWAQEVVAKIRELQIRYLREILTKKDDSSFVYLKTQEVLAEISKLLRAEIVEGAELLAEIPKGKPVLVMTNHFGLYKLAGIDPRKDLGVDIPGYDFMYPSPLYFAGLNPVGEAVGNDLSYVSNEFPGVFGEIHQASGFIHVPPKTDEGVSRTGLLTEQTGDVINKNPNIAIVNYPEGGTSGKYNGLGPYDLEPFKTGGYVIASKLGVHVVPVAQYFDPEKGLRLRVFRPYIPFITEKETFEDQAKKDKDQMQEWLNEQQNR